jgi:hypothetical protein
MASFGLVIKKHGVVNIVIFAALWSLWKLRNDLSFSECWLERDGYPAEQNCLYGAELANHVPGEQGFLPEYGGGTEDVSLEKLQVVDRMQSFLKMKQAGAGYFFRCFASLELLQTGVIESQCYRSCNAWVLSASGTFWLLPLRLVIQWPALLSFFLRRLFFTRVFSYLGLRLVPCSLELISQTYQP